MEKPKTKNSFRKKSDEKPVKKWFDNKFLPAVGKVGNQRHLGAIRDSFGTMIPLIIAGSIGVLINAIIFGGAGSGYVSLLGLLAKASHSSMSWTEVGDLISKGSETMPGWHQASQIGGLAFGHISTVTIGMMSIWFSFLFGYYIAISRGFRSPIIAGMVSTSAFFLASLGEVGFFMDAKGLIAAIIFGILATELFIYLSNIRWLNIKLPDGVPPAVGKSFQVFLPAFITLASVGALNIIVLAPAIVGQNLAVTQSQSFVFSPKSWSELFVNSQQTNNAVQALLKDAKFANHEGLLNDLMAMFSTGSEAQWKTWYEGLTFENQKVITSAVASISATNIGSIWNINQSSIMSFVSDGTGYIVSFSWMATILGPNKFGFSAAIYQFITSWFIGFATGSGGIGIAILYVFLISLFWFFGIHGSNVIGGIFEPIFLMILGINSALVLSLGYEAAAATGQMGVFARSFFDSYAYVGGAGSTLGLVVPIMFFSKRRELKEISKFAIPAGVFQINEPVIFGIPIILNPVFVVPFVVAPIFSLMVGWIFSPAVLGFVKYSYIAVPWTSPWFLAAVLTSLDIKALVPALISGVVAVGFYLPFILLDNKLHFKKLQKTDQELFVETMRYYNDPKYKFISDTQTKYDNMLNQIETIQGTSTENIDWWTEKLTKKTQQEKLDQKISQIQSKTDAKVISLTQKAENFKARREALIPKKETSWAKIREKKMAKLSPDLVAKLGKNS